MGKKIEVASLRVREQNERLFVFKPTPESIDYRSCRYYYKRQKGAEEIHAEITVDQRAQPIGSDTLRVKCWPTAIASLFLCSLTVKE